MFVIWRTSCEAPLVLPILSNSCSDLTCRSPVCRRYKPLATMAKPPVLAVLAITLCAALSCGTCPPLPSITSISPAAATAGGSQFVLTIKGENFRHDSVVKWSGSPLVTIFGNSNQLLAAVSAADIAQPGTVLVFVFNPPEGGTTSVSGAIGATSATACGGKNSNGVSFTIKP
jgi:IPT/TIG domain